VGRRRAPGTVAPVDLTVRGDDVYPRARAYVLRKIGAALRSAGAPVPHAHAVLTVEPDPALERPARLEVGLDVRGVPVRVHATGHHVGEAADLAEDRLRRRLRRLRGRTRTRHRWIGIAREHEWRHGDLPRRPVPFFPRPPEQRRVVRRKTFGLEPMCVDRAVDEMHLVDHDFYLFTDVATGESAVAHRVGDRPGEEVGVERRPPALTENQARERLDLGGEPYVFYADPADGRGRVLYRRYDGHYGLIAGRTAGTESGRTE
jgi:ribosome-associated translation inhibitor RaiA